MSEESTVVEKAEEFIESFVETTTKDPVIGFNDKGMHPGVINGKRVYPKVNTAEPYKSGKGKLAQHQRRLGQRRSAHSQTIARLPGNTPATAFKTPGSMKQHNGG